MARSVSHLNLKSPLQSSTRYTHTHANLSHYVAYPKRKSSSLFPLDILLTQVCTATTTYIVIDLLLWPCVLHQPASRSSIRSPFIHLNFLFHQPTNQPPVSFAAHHSGYRHSESHRSPHGYMHTIQLCGTSSLRLTRQICVYV